MVIRMPIDIKSLYLNIKNDNRTGHTATVATPLKQGASVHSELSQIMNLPENMTQKDKERLSSQILAKSRADARIVKAFRFDSIMVNGSKVETNAAYCIYVREETNPHNVHFGRQKVHYPQILVYEGDDIHINNQLVLRAVSKTLNDYAFIVQAFEYDTDSKTLNFDALIVGENSVPYSKVFVNRRGVGAKFSTMFTHDAENYDIEIIALRQRMGYTSVSTDNYNDIILANKADACNLVCDYLMNKGASTARILKFEYPYSLYDIFYEIDGKKKYAIIQQTATREKYFVLSMEKIQFINDFSDSASVFLVTDIKGKPQVIEYTPSMINTLKKTISSIRFEDRGQTNE